MDKLFIGLSWIAGFCLVLSASIGVVQSFTPDPVDLTQAYFSLKDQCQGTIMIEEKGEEIGFKCEPITPTCNPHIGKVTGIDGYTCTPWVASSTSSSRLKN